MKAIKYEPLKNKKQELKGKNGKEKNKDFSLGFEKGIEDSFSLFADYIDLYKHYQNNVKILMNEQKNVWKKWVEYYEKQTNVDKSDYLDIYNTWLFNYIFSNLDGNSNSFLDL